MPFAKGQSGNPSTQFKPGQSGNPNGVPKGTKHINTWVQELMEDEEFEAQIREGYEIKTYKGAPVKAIVKAQIRKAIDGDTMAYKALVDSGWAKKTETDLTSGGDKLQPVMVQFIDDPKDTHDTDTEGV